VGSHHRDVDMLQFGGPPGADFMGDRVERRLHKAAVIGHHGSGENRSLVVFEVTDLSDGDVVLGAQSVPDFGDRAALVFEASGPVHEQL